MKPSQADRFATGVLQQNHSDDVFEVEVPPAEQSMVAEAFRRLGCRVSTVPHKPWLRIQQGPSKGGGIDGGSER